MNIITLNIGNSKVSISGFQDEESIHYESSDLTEFNIANLIEQVTSSKADLAVASVNPEFFINLKNQFKEFQIEIFELTWKSKINFKNLYKTPQTLGVDRIANLGAAVGLESVPAVIVDAGTAITIDVINSRKEYTGGVIIPGREIQARALNSFTEQLPIVNLDWQELEPGTSTEQSINRGINQVTLFGVNDLINEFCSRESKTTILKTGGDRMLLEKLSDGEYIKNLTHIGIKEIFKLNKSSKLS